MTEDDCVLIVFTKAPVPGKVKTRLLSTLGATAAADLYQSLVIQTLQTARSSDVSMIQLWCAGNIEHPFLVKCAADFNVELHLQQGGDLGARLHSAVSTALGRFRYVIIIGCDCPVLSPEDINNACGKLKDGIDTVLGPAEDGGYYLVGTGSAHRELFDYIPWGSKAVLQETRARLQGLGQEWFELSEHWDLDRPVDLARYNKLTSTAHEQ